MDGRRSVNTTMIKKVLISLGLASIPFWTIPGQIDTRQPKLILAVMVALTIGLWVLSHEGFKPVKNKILVAFIGYLAISVFMSPTMSVMDMDKALHSVNLPYVSLFHILSFFLMFIAIAGMKLSQKDTKFYLTIMVWTAFIMTFYCALQAIGIDQFFELTNKHPDAHNVPGRDIVGTLGHPTLLGPYIAMCIPIAVCLRKYAMAICMAIIVALTLSQVALGGMVISLLFLLGTRGKKRLIVAIIVGLSLITILSTGINRYSNGPMREFVNDSGRFRMWGKIVQDLNSPLHEGNPKKYAITGFGLGSFGYMFMYRHSNPGNQYKQAHNDYLELLYNAGVIGFLLFIAVILHLFIHTISIKRIWKGEANKYRMCLLSAFICIAVCAGANFVWQLGPHGYYTVFIAGLLYNKGGLC